MDMICAFSSDARELYKADIYRALALPCGYLLHFRYKKRYVDAKLIASKPVGKKAVIFFTSGVKEGVNNLTHLSIREAQMRDFYISDETDVVHVYMQLGKFCNFRVDHINLRLLYKILIFSFQCSLRWFVLSSHWCK